MARVIGLTGGIASGKSTVARMLRELGAQVVDADELARQVVEPGRPAHVELRAQFGDDYFHPDGTLNRKRLASLVFADDDARRELERITHPRIAAASQEAICRLSAQGHSSIFYEAALLVENGLHHGLAGLLVVSVPESVQLERLMARDSLDSDEAQSRLAAQLPLADKVAVADWVVDNSGSLEETRAKVANIWSQIRTSE